MKYIVKTVSDVNWDDIQKADIASYTWGKDYTPKAFAQLVIEKDKGFRIKMTCEEKEPRVTYYNYNDPVYKDSAMEFFASFDNTSKKYMNFEINSVGTFLCAVRVEKNNKTPIDKLVDIRDIVVKTDKTDSIWSVDVLFPFEVVEKLFGIGSFEKGYEFKGNFYKCGDDTAIPHFGSWAPITLESPNFHCPDFFGTLVIE